MPSFRPGARSADGASPLVVRRRKLYKNNSARLNLLRILSFFFKCVRAQEGRVRETQEEQENAGESACADLCACLLFVTEFPL